MPSGVAYQASEEALREKRNGEDPIRRVDRSPRAGYRSASASSSSPLPLSAPPRRSRRGRPPPTTRGPRGRKMDISSATTAPLSSSFLVPAPPLPPASLPQTRLAGDPCDSRLVDPRRAPHSKVWCSFKLLLEIGRKNPPDSAIPELRRHSGRMLPFPLFALPVRRKSPQRTTTHIPHPPLSKTGPGLGFVGLQPRALSQSLSLSLDINIYKYYVEHAPPNIG